MSNILSFETGKRINPKELPKQLGATEKILGEVMIKRNVGDKTDLTLSDFTEVLFDNYNTVRFDEKLGDFFPKVKFQKLVLRLMQELASLL